MNPQRTDQQLLAESPDYIVIGSLFKASPLEEGGKRILLMEASNEDAPDFENEIVLQQALAESTDYFLKYGNIDLSHYTLMGPSKSGDGTVKPGIPNHLDYEIGKPVDVRLDGSRTFVKAELYQGDSAQARNASTVWDSLTKQAPPSRWYPSVGGQVMKDFNQVKVDPATGQRVTVITKVRWNNIALDRCPVNRTVPEVSVAPMGIFAKSLNGFIMKSLDTGYGTDSAALEGGAALGLESLYGKPYGHYRDCIAKGLLDGALKPRQIKAFSTRQFGFTEADADHFTHQFLTDLKNQRNTQ